MASVSARRPAPQRTRAELADRRPDMPYAAAVLTRPDSAIGASHQPSAREQSSHFVAIEYLTESSAAAELASRTTGRRSRRPRQHPRGFARQTAQLAQPESPSGHFPQPRLDHGARTQPGAEYARGHVAAPRPAETLNHHSAARRPSGSSDRSRTHPSKSRDSGIDLGERGWQVLGSNQRRLSRRFYRPRTIRA
jgi:hypothetical protein